MNDVTVKKYSDLSKDEKSDLVTWTWDVETHITEGNGARCIHNDEIAKFGICGRCKCFESAETEFSILFAYCNAFRRSLSQHHRITNCTSFDDKATVSLAEMKEIAWIIDISEHKVGFKI